MAVKGKINKILKNSFVDGPGNRAVIFLQGCNFNCLACHNPYTLTICNNCGVCVPACKYQALTFEGNKVIWNEAVCEGCDACLKACPNHSSPHTREASADQIWEKIHDLVPYLTGITASGGEPTLQMEFLIELFQIVKSHSDLTTVIETNGCVETAQLAKLLPVLDGVMIDLKAWDKQIHYEVTGKKIDAVLEAIEYLATKKKILAIRHLVLANYTSDKDVTAMAQFIKKIDAEIPLHFLRFRPQGTFGIAAKWESPSDEFIDHLMDVAIGQGLKHVKKSL